MNSDFISSLFLNLIASEKFVNRAMNHDVEASFPSKNYIDLHEQNLLGICIPKPYGGRGADLKTYSLTPE